jgi:hypothetical protein
MDEVDSLLGRAERYRMMAKSVADEVAIHAMSAMAEYLENQAMQLIDDQAPTTPEHGVVH